MPILVPYNQPSTKTPFISMMIEFLFWLWENRVKNRPPHFWRLLVCCHMAAILYKIRIRLIITSKTSIQIFEYSSNFCDELLNSYPKIRFRDVDWFSTHLPLLVGARNFLCYSSRSEYVSGQSQKLGKGCTDAHPCYYIVVGLLIRNVFTSYIQFTTNVVFLFRAGRSLKRYFWEWYGIPMWKL